MRAGSKGFEVVRLPKTRRAIVDMLGEGQKKHMVHGLMEMDVTEARRAIREQKARAGETLSFTAFMVYCLALAVAQDPLIQGYRKGRHHLLLFDDVDVNTQIEREVNGRKWMMPYIIRAAKRRTFREIHDEIRAAQVKEVERAEEFSQFTGTCHCPRRSEGSSGVHWRDLRIGARGSLARWASRPSGCSDKVPAGASLSPR